ncbi:phytoene desaturase family protein [Pseudotabrizicola alkalilacus]|uniref:Pyridine nucleotide-disulfide oxidoreductase domain-containing protein 2 n=1 Tax=Pseudotabrizicola alkalilacus TaxID=2305252 RepID=A0A411Z0E8_9RHOB|nr:NAD(P)/FAD-dependent oxidoreductase [Pseudotabrizicola alkalilacus]RGP36539.1 NAD(P)/FAD-dependent oxidoreductase [Pseudotabrizicola alkalilacus]
MAGEFDAVLIGAGHNTLAAALHLAAKGWRVAVFEQAAVAGGAVKTGEYTLPGFRHDWAAMNLSLFAGSPFFKVYGAELTRHGCAFVPVNRPFASSFSDGSWAGVSTDMTETLAAIGAISAQDAATWETLAAGFQAEAPHLFGLLGSEMKLRALASFLFRTLRAKGLGGTLDMGRFLVASPRAWLEETFAHPHIRALLGAWGMHLDFAPDVAGGAIFPYLEGMAGQAFGMVIGQGGADTVTRALVAAIEARGGVVETSTPVARIVHDRGRASGVELADGRHITARRTVIAGVAPGALPRLTGGTTPAFDRAMGGYRHAPGTMMIHLAMDALPDWKAGPALQRQAYVHIAPSLDQMARTYQQALAGLLPDEPILVVGQPTVYDPSRAPDGKHVLWVQIRMAPGTITGDAGGEITATDWADAATPFAERALAILEAHAPGTRSRILARHIVTPLDLEADNPNLVGGDQVCGSHHLSQHFLFRPARGHADGSTPIANLHLTGAAVWPGGGTGAGSGFLLARKLAGN